MKKSKRLSAILAPTILILLMLISSLVAISGGAISNWNPNTGKVDRYNADYLTKANSGQSVAAKYGNLLQDAYEWDQYVGNGGARDGYNPGPAPDRPDVIWRSDLLPTTLGTPHAGQIAFSGKLFTASTVTPYGNSTTRHAINALDPLTGALIWQTVLDKPVATVTAPFGGDCLYKIDNTHLMALTSMGVIMFNASNGKQLWYDTDISPNAVYHPGLYDENTKMFFGPELPFDEVTYGMRYYVDYGWDMSNPDLDKGIGGRQVWSRVRNYPGNPMLCVGQGLVFMGSYQSAMVYALNQTNGNLVWETAKYDAAGYAGVYGEGRLVVGCQSTWIMCFNATDGKLLWENKEGTGNRAFNVWQGLIAYGRTYWHDLGEGYTGATRCLDLKTGKTLWRAITTEYIGYYQTCVADGKIYGMLSDASTTTGRDPIAQTFACWDAYTGAVIWKINPRAAIAWPIVAFGSLYFVFDSVAYGISTATAPVNWPMWRGTVENPGIALGTGPLDISQGPKWTFTTGASIGSSPAIVNGKVYINSGDRNVYCLDAYSGSMIWKFATSQPLMTTFDSTPAVTGNKVIIGPDDGNIYCLDATTGAKIWSIPTGTWRMVQSGSGQFQTRSSPIIYKDRIYVSSAHDNKTYCVDLNGNIIWTFTTTTPVLGSVAIENDVIYFLSTSGSPARISSTNLTMGTAFKLSLTGQLLMSWPMQAVFRSGGAQYASMQTPVVYGDKMFVGVNTAYGVCYNVTTGILLWAVENPYVLTERSQGSPVYVPYSFVRPANATTGTFFGNTGGVVICNAGPTMAAQRADNGSNLWSAWGGWEVFSSPVFAGISQGSRIYSGSESYGMTSWDAATGQPMSWFTTNGGLTGSVGIYDGKLYFGSTDNKVYCFEDHVDQQTAISMSVDKTQMQPGDSITVKATLNKPQLEGESYGFALLNPALSNAKVLFTFTNPTGVSSTLTGTTDNQGLATTSFAPNVAGTWKVIASYNGEHKPTTSYSYAFSDQINVEVTTTPATATPAPTETPATATPAPTETPATATPTPATSTPTPATSTPTPATSTPTASPTGGSGDMTLVYVAVAVVVVVVIVAALFLMKRKK